MIVLEDTYGAPQCGIEVTKFDTIFDLEDYLDEHEDVYHRILAGYANFHEEEGDMTNFVICDWETKGNAVRLYCCDQDKYDDIWGDDWNDRPYEHNAGRVYDGYIDKIVDIYFDFDVVVLEADDDWEFNGNSPFSKQDFKEGKAPIFIVYLPHKDDYWSGNEYHLLIGAKNTDRILKFYMGDRIESILTPNKKIVRYIVQE